ncbi:PLP-dependent aminotransferase family protein [Streptomyces sp. ZSW22]|uniref:MocR-like pyridoxine biosynthesis transcription factor PdxR n=1 Tax=Streptomyces sp. ZSW22 TaxID=3055050 RepID=UPI0025AFBC2B|nr:PLP-dependent aminotransferase family protein [Streptomyces sp. ZSW22]MDN3245949.1 PLP-dependent aminotransferase family protein [Streptomyces sp. ZSW22]
MANDRTDSAWGTFLELGRPAEGPMHVRLTRALRAAVTGGRIASGSALPPSRTLAADLGCSRWVVTEAYAQLVAEGYLEARSGSATRVRAQAVPVPATSPADAGTRWEPEFDMLPGVPDLRAFPRRQWAEAVREATGALTWGELGYPDAAGLARLRQRLAAYLVRGRGASLDARQLVVCGGTLDAVLRVCRVLRADGHSHVAVEDPGWSRLGATVRAAGLVPVPVPVDGDGLRVDLLRHAPQVRSVIVAPAHQFPTGVVLAPARRADLVAWAREVDGLVLEDDYDAEFRYDRHPVGAVQGMAPEHVVLMGSVSKTLSPALRIGWAVAPPRWAAALAAEHVGGMPPPVIDQEAFARFLDRGAYDRHLRASRLRYKRRRDHLLGELAASLPGFRVSGAAAGFHLLLSLTDRSAPAVVEEAARHDVRLADLDDYRMVRAGDGAGPELVLGYGNLADQAVPGAVRRLARAVDAARLRDRRASKDGRAGERAG